MTPQEQREKVLRDALVLILAQCDTPNESCEAECLEHDIAKAALAAADAIPDAPVCPNCGPLGNDFCTWHGHRPAPSRAELIDLMCVTLRPYEGRSWLGTVLYFDMTRVLDALIKAGAVRL